MSWFKKTKKKDPVISETLSLTADHVITPPSDRHESSLDQISYDLQGRLKRELNGILGEVVDTAIDNCLADIEQMIRNELITLLEDRLDKLVEQAIKKHLTKPRDRDYSK